MARHRVLFVCTHNSARSQMAEGLLRFLHSDRFDVYSAGTAPTRVHPMAIQVMHELGIDISAARSEYIDRYMNENVDIVVTVCDSAKEQCPYMPARLKNIHHGFPDPSGVEGTEAERRTAFRRVRDEIKAWIENELINVALSSTQ